MGENNPNKKHPILSRFKMTRTANDMKDVLTGKGDFSVTYKLALIVGEGLFCAVVLFFIFRLIINPLSPLTLISFIIAFGYLAIFFVVGIITQETDGKYSRVVVGVALTLIMPEIWLYSGGFEGAGAVWFIFGAIFLCAGLSLKQYIRIIPVYIVTLFATVFISVKYPEMIQSESASISHINTIGSICISVVFFSMIILLQRHISELDRDEMTKLREEISESNEELTAGNQELRAINEELMDVTEKLQTSMDKQKMFSASVTHELRSPLNGIEGSLQMMLLSGTLDEENKTSVENALNACRNLTRTVDDMLDFSKLSEGKFEIVKRKFDFRDVINDIRYLFEEQARKKGLDFMINVPVTMKCSLIGDDARISQVLTNLISNSIKYTNEGSVVCDINVQNDAISFTVKDTGIGMSKESLGVLFDPFTRFDLKRNSGIQGTGLGMNIVYNLVKAMNGEIKVESELNKGSAFFVNIPVAIDDDTVIYSGIKEEKKQTEFLTEDFSNVNILCIDDTKINLVVFKGLLKPTNAKIDTALSYFEGMEAVEAKKYDLIFVDHFMPERDGIDVFRDLRRGNSVNKDTPVIMLTGNSMGDYISLYKQEGFNGWLSKPIAQNELVKIIKDYI